jgi:hypothetical protein
VVYGTEKPELSKRTRIVIVTVLWLFPGLPLLYAFWATGLWWLALLVVVPGVWATIDYVRKGGQFDQIDKGVAGGGRYVPNAWRKDR